MLRVLSTQGRKFSFSASLSNDLFCTCGSTRFCAGYLAVSSPLYFTVVGVADNNIRVIKKISTEEVPFVTDPFLVYGREAMCFLIEFIMVDRRDKRMYANNGSRDSAMNFHEILAGFLST